MAKIKKYRYKVSPNTSDQYADQDDMGYLVHGGVNDLNVVGVITDVSKLQGPRAKRVAKIIATALNQAQKDGRI